MQSVGDLLQGIAIPEEQMKYSEVRTPIEQFRAGQRLSIMGVVTLRESQATQQNSRQERKVIGHATIV